MFPGFYYQAAAEKTDISEYRFWNWKAQKGSKIRYGQDTYLDFEDPRIFRHLYFTQYGNECQFMTHSREAGTEQMTARATKHEFRPMIMVMTCNAENKFVESKIRIDDANRKIVISYPGKEQQTIIPTRTIKKSTTEPSTTSNSVTETSPLEEIERKCTQLGFTKGTEKHGDCVMKLYK